MLPDLTDLAIAIATLPQEHQTRILLYLRAWVKSYQTTLAAQTSEQRAVFQEQANAVQAVVKRSGNSWGGVMEPQLIWKDLVPGRQRHFTELYIGNGVLAATITQWGEHSSLDPRKYQQVFEVWLICAKERHYFDLEFSLPAVKAWVEMKMREYYQDVIYGSTGIWDGR